MFDVKVLDIHCSGPQSVSHIDVFGHVLVQLVGLTRVLALECNRVTIEYLDLGLSL